MKGIIEYTKPVALDLKKGREVVRTVMINGRYIEVMGRYYKVCGTDLSNTEGSHLLCNMATNEWRWVSGSVIRVWVDRESELVKKP